MASHPFFTPTPTWVEPKIFEHFGGIAVAPQPLNQAPQTQRDMSDEVSVDSLLVYHDAPNYSTPPRSKAYSLSPSTAPSSPVSQASVMEAEISPSDVSQHPHLCDSPNVETRPFPSMSQFACPIAHPGCHGYTSKARVPTSFEVVSRHI